MLNLIREWIQLQLNIDMLFNVVRTIFDFVLTREKTVQWKLVFSHILRCVCLVLNTRLRCLNDCCCQKSSSRGCSVKKLFLEILQNSQENTCTVVFLRIATLLKKRLWHRCFPVNFVKLLSTLDGCLYC